MAKNELKQLAVKLRLEGRSYSQIKEEIQVSKGTLSLWLRDFPLAPERLRELRDFSEKRIENFRKTMQAKRAARLENIYKEQSEILYPLTSRDILFAGLGLYWGEGGKTMPTQLTISNTNPAVIRFFMRCMEEAYNVPRKKFIARLQLYQDMNTEQEISFWRKELHLPRGQFMKPYFKKSKTTDITYRRVFTHGTCNLSVRDVKIAEAVFMGIKYLEDSMRP